MILSYSYRWVIKIVPPQKKGLFLHIFLEFEGALVPQALSWTT